MLLFLLVLFGVFDFEDRPITITIVTRAYQPGLTADGHQLRIRAHGEGPCMPTSHNDCALPGLMTIAGRRFLGVH